MQNSEQRIQTACLVILSFVSIAFALYWLRPVMVPFILALFFQLMLKAVIDLQRYYLRVPKKIAIITTILFSAVIIFAASVLVSSSVTEMIDKADVYRGNIKQLVARVPTDVFPESWGIDIKQSIRSVSENLSNQVGQMIKATGSAIVNIFSQGVVVFIFFLFLAIGSVRRNSAVSDVWRKGEQKVKIYIGAKFTLSALQGLAVGFVLSLLGIDLALMFGLFAFILNFIPSIGPIIATVLPLPIVLLSSDISLFQSVVAIALPGIIMFVLGNVVEPKVVGDTLRLQPVAILMALIFWGMLWGITGMFLAVPLTAVLTLILEEIEFTRPVADLLTADPPSPRKTRIKKKQ
jgi:AI-2 transport protein TqsA